MAKPRPRQLAAYAHFLRRLAAKRSDAAIGYDFPNMGRSVLLHPALVMRSGPCRHNRSRFQVDSTELATLES
ncbi:hypothetical protein GCM10010220_67940 [Streptomyces parvulus]|nr:hypothetical protein GCM10010220_67940 [Streptomyces parvulus]